MPISPLRSFPNLLTLFRLLCGVVLFFLLHLSGGDPHHPAQRVSVFLLIFASLTDIWDGVLARKMGVTFLGKVLDPTADKILVYSILLPLTMWGKIPLWVLWVFLGRDFLVTSLRIVAVEEKKDISADWGGKGKTILQFIALPLLLWETDLWFFSPSLLGEIFLYLSLILSCLSGARYFVVYFPKNG